MRWKQRDRAAGELRSLPRSPTPDEVWLQHRRATRHVGASLGARRSVGVRPSGRIASSCLLGPPAGEGWLAVGDAASCYDPISSQGIIKGLDAGLRVAPIIQRWLDGDHEALGEYAVSIIHDFRIYLRQRDDLYASEQRWADEPFWARRRQRRNLQASVGLGPVFG